MSLERQKLINARKENARLTQENAQLKRLLNDFMRIVMENPEMEKLVREHSKLPHTPVGCPDLGDGDAPNAINCTGDPQDHHPV